MGGDYRADGVTDAQMHVGDGGDAVVDEGQAGDAGELPLRAFVDVVGPDLDRRGGPVKNLFYGHGVVPRICLSTSDTRARLPKRRRLVPKVKHAVGPALRPDRACKDIQASDDRRSRRVIRSDLQLRTALEARRDKTYALCQGMMQELLTGRTRLI